MVLGFIAVLVAFNANTSLSQSGGLLQRLWIVAGWGWLSLLGAHMLVGQRTKLDDRADGIVATDPDQLRLLVATGVGDERVMGHPALAVHPTRGRESRTCRRRRTAAEVC